MTFTATGSWRGSASTTLTLSNQAIGNLLIVEVINCRTSTVWCSGLSGGSATWVRPGTKLSGTTNHWYNGGVSRDGHRVPERARSTPTWSGTAPAPRNMAGHEFLSRAGGRSISGHPGHSGTANWPSLTPC